MPRQSALSATHHFAARCQCEKRSKGHPIIISILTVTIAKLGEPQVFISYSRLVPGQAAESACLASAAETARARRWHDGLTALEASLEANQTSAHDNHCGAKKRPRVGGLVLDGHLEQERKGDVHVAGDIQAHRRLGHWRDEEAGRGGWHAPHHCCRASPLNLERPAHGPLPEEAEHTDAGKHDPTLGMWWCGDSSKECDHAHCKEAEAAEPVSGDHRMHFLCTGTAVSEHSSAGQSRCKVTHLECTNRQESKCCEHSSGEGEAPRDVVLKLRASTSALCVAGAAHFALAEDKRRLRDKHGPAEAEETSNSVHPSERLAPHLHGTTGVRNKRSHGHHRRSLTILARTHTMTGLV